MPGKGAAAFYREARQAALPQLPFRASEHIYALVEAGQNAGGAQDARRTLHSLRRRHEQTGEAHFDLDKWAASLSDFGLNAVASGAVPSRLVLMERLRYLLAVAPAES